MSLFLYHISNFDMALGVAWVLAFRMGWVKFHMAYLCRPDGSCVLPLIFSLYYVLCLVTFLFVSDCRSTSISLLLDRLGLEQTSAAQVGSSATRVGPSTAAHVGSFVLRFIIL